MKPPLDKFNSIAAIYDRLANLAFGKSILMAQIQFLPLLPNAGNVLILGGGTGWIAEQILMIRKEIRIYYIEASSEMIARTRKRIGLADNIVIIHGTEADIPRDILFDAIITNFFLDLFTDEKLDNLIRRLRSCMKVTARWIVTDFVDQRVWWQTLLLKIMYFFFRTVAKIESNALPQWESRIENMGFKSIARKDFFSRFIRTTAYSQ